MSCPTTSRPAASDEGYVKYACEHSAAPSPSHPLLSTLDTTRTALYDLGLIGATPSGISFGNLSLRTDGLNFIISGTGTGGRRELGPDGYSMVTGCDPRRNRVICQGKATASSEAMSHWAVYVANPGVNCVIHIHSEPLFQALLVTDALRTPESAPCGTPALADAISHLVRNHPSERGLFVTTGHTDGIFAYGPDIGAVLNILVALYRDKLF